MNGVAINKVVGTSASDWTATPAPKRYQAGEVDIVLLIEFAPYVTSGANGPRIALAVLGNVPLALRPRMHLVGGKMLPILEGGQVSPIGVPWPPALIIPTPVSGPTDSTEDTKADAPMNLPPNQINHLAPPHNTIVYPAPLYRWLVLPS